MVDAVGLCDLSAVMAEATAEQYHVPRWFTDHRQMLGELNPDVVHITTPPGSHVPLAIDALEAGAHVLVEKPIALNPEDLERLKSIAERRKLLVLEDHNYLFNSSVQRILSLIASNEFGQVLHTDVMFCVDILGPGSRHADPNAPHPFSSLPGGAIADFVTHLAYLAYAFVGEHRSVRTIWRKRGEVDALPWDEFRALVDAEHGTAALGFSAHSRPDVFWLRVHGTKMRATASLFEPLLAIERPRGGPRALTPLLNGMSVACAYGRSGLSGLWRKLAGRPITYEGLWRLLQRFYESLEAGSEPPVPMRQIEAVNRLVWDLLRHGERP